MSSPALQALDLDALPPAVREAFLAMQAEVAGLRAQTERQDYLIAELRHALYGKRSEQLDPDDRQLAFEDLETAVAEAEAARDAIATCNANGTTRRPAAKRNLGHLPDHLPRIEEVIEPGHRVCSCGCADMVKIGEDRSERLDIIPTRLQVIVTIRPRYACRRCDGGVLQAATPARLIEGGLPTEGTLAHVVVSKYADHLPLYRQSQIYARGGVDLDRSTLATWCGKVGFHLAPVVDRMLVHLKRSTRLFMDETRAPVLDPGAGKTKTGYLWALTRDDRGWGGGDPPAVVFTYAPGRSGSHAMDILRGFDGILQVDGYAGYDALAEPRRVGGKPLTLAYCWAHARRKLHDIYQKDGSEIAAEGLRRIAQIMAPFVHCSPLRPGRFSDGSFGLYYAGDRTEVAIAETIHHHARFMRATNEAPGWASQFRELIGSVDAEVDDATGRADLLDPDDYRASQVFGAERRAAGSNGITWPSIRYPEGQCIAVFWPDVIPIPTQGSYFAYHWNGSAVDFVSRMDTGEVMEVT